jgi:hypothetical protein
VTAACLATSIPDPPLLAWRELNQIGVAGAVTLSFALKINATLTSLK